MSNPVDYRLPDADGASAAARIRATNPDSQVVMLTGLGDDRLVVAAIESGCAAFLTKDKASTELVAAIRVAHSGEAYIAPAMLANLLRRMDRSYHGVGSDLTARERETSSRSSALTPSSRRSRSRLGRAWSGPDPSGGARTHRCVWCRCTSSTAAAVAPDMFEVFLDDCAVRLAPLLVLA